MDNTKCSHVSDKYVSTNNKTTCGIQQSVCLCMRSLQQGVQGAASASAASLWGAWESIQWVCCKEGRQRWQQASQTVQVSVANDCCSMHICMCCVILLYSVGGHFKLHALLAAHIACLMIAPLPVSCLNQHMWYEQQDCLSSSQTTRQQHACWLYTDTCTLLLMRQAHMWGPRLSG